MFIEVIFPPAASVLLVSTLCSLFSGMAGVTLLRTAATFFPSRMLLPLTLRTYASASAVQIQSDDEEYEDYFYSEEEPKPISERCFRGRGVQWVVIGDPGAQKHVYAEKLSKLLHVPHISMGTLLREELHPCSSLYQKIANALNQRKLVTEEITFGLLSKRLEQCYYKGETGFILDGIPRTRVQAEILDQLVDIDLVVNFKCLRNDRCSHCSQFDSPRVSISNMQLQGSSQSSPNDNLGTSFSDKGQSYAEQSNTLEEYYMKQRKLLNFKTGGAPRETWQGLLAALHLRPTPPHSVICPPPTN